jgi:hypothetical protein
VAALQFELNGVIKSSIDYSVMTLCPVSNDSRPTGITIVPRPRVILAVTGQRRRHPQ